MKKLLIVLSFILTPFLATAETTISTPISTNTTWTASAGPYIVTGDIQVDPGVTLTIEPGTVVKFSSSSARLYINNSTVVAHGTSGQPIFFTSYKDDTVGGDTNGDGSATEPAWSDWSGLRVVNGGTFDLSHGSLRYGGSADYGIFVAPGTLILDSVTVNNGSNHGNGIFIGDGATATISNSTFAGNQYAFQNNGTATVSNSSFTDGDAAFITFPGSVLTISSVTYTNLNYLGYLSASASLTASGGTASGTGIRGYKVTGSITAPTIWKKLDFPYLLYTQTNIEPTGTLTLQAGTVIKNQTGTPGALYVNGGALTAQGTAQNPIFITSGKDDDHGGDTNNDGTNTTPTDADWPGVRVVNDGSAHLTYTTISFGGDSGFGIAALPGALSLDHVTIKDNGSIGVLVGTDTTAQATITDSSISGHQYGIYKSVGTVALHQSSIAGNSQYGVYNANALTPVDATDNWWGDASGPFQASTNAIGTGDRVSDGVTYIPWLESDPTHLCNTGVSGCASNLIFFPGIMGSHLYDATPGVNVHDVHVWPSINEDLQSKLQMNSSGVSIKSLYTANDTKRDDYELEEDGIIEADTLSRNIYKSFILDLKDWKNEGVYNDYAFIPYDWRQSLNQIVASGKVSADGQRLTYDGPEDFTHSFIYQKFSELAATSRSGKVSIVAHSNGGLVAKKFIEKLRLTQDPLYQKIDKIILIAVPQVGTPDALLSLLHGTNIGPAGIYVDKEMTRKLSKNMPMMYNLLPTQAYFDKIALSHPEDKNIVTFPNTQAYIQQFAEYGSYIDSAAEVQDYLNNQEGDESRDTITDSEVSKPLVANNSLIAASNTTHSLLDAWIIPPNAKVIQVAGWGIETTSSLNYGTVKKLSISGVPYDEPVITIKTVLDGDETVIADSARYMNASTNVENWWVNLLNAQGGNIDRFHKDILEVSNLRQFIEQKILNNTFTPTTIVTQQLPDISQVGARVHYHLHSPLYLGVTDSQGRYTGLDPTTNTIKEEIPGVYYKQVGEVQFLSVPTEIAYTLTMKGYEAGSFALDVDKQEGNTITESTSFQAVPSTPDTIATISVIPNQPVADTELKVDFNGDNTVDSTLTTNPSGVTIYDTTPPELKTTFDLTQTDVLLSAFDTIDPQATLAHSGNTITLTDATGNTTTINLTKYKESPTKLKLTYNSITRNGVTTTVPNTTILYDWSLYFDGTIKNLDTKVTIKGVEKYLFNYKKNTNMTTIKVKQGSTYTTTTQSGPVPVTVVTKEDGVGVSY